MTSLQQLSQTLEGNHAIRFGDGIVLLDIAGDSYSCLYDPAGRTTADPFPDTRSSGSGHAGVPADRRQVCARWRDLPAGDSRVRPRDILRFVAALSVATIRFHRNQFAGLLGIRKDRGRIRRTVSPDDLATIIARFEYMALFLPVPILCLFRSFFLLHFLGWYGCTADWVFGVTLFPFRAHCWLASGDLLIGEKADRALQFSPIHVVRARQP